MIDRFLKALATEKAALAQEQGKAMTKQQTADAGLTQVGQQQLDVLMKLSDCTDAAAAKDPRSKEMNRLSSLSEAATAKGDDKLSENYSDEASKLSGSITSAALDGGISAQLLLREGEHTRVWRGWRPVPLGLVAEPLSAAQP